ncbi:phosphotransferase [Bradyrhizobium sp. CB82]|uniref:phosphotransferase enzyme family protein n=1 Tax=Bradyrhizobium sp. CB82 TaxID=3039159 RepID=UPI0024B07F02|nr:phosphotransferase [Bradyrhizobium sp. CB82]WFU42028.1 phosphotransferase [Bradyrhizobium sp. CB82]
MSPSPQPDDGVRGSQAGAAAHFGRALLEPFGFALSECELLQSAENDTFRVMLRSSDRNIADDSGFLLRIHGYQTAESVDEECEWLEYVRAVTPVRVPEPYRLFSDGWAGVVGVAGPRAGRAFSLLRWVPGTAMDGSRPNGAEFRRLGELTARLHVAARSWPSAKLAGRPTWDAAGLFLGVNGFGCIDSAGWKAIPSHCDRQFRWTVRYLTQLLEGLRGSPDAMGLIHGDMHFGNAIDMEDSLAIIDFDDCGTGFLVYDIASSLRPWRFDIDWPTLKSVYCRGYESVCELPIGIELLDAFIVARHLATTLWAASRCETCPALAQTLPARLAATANAIAALLPVDTTIEAPSGSEVAGL